MLPEGHKHVFYHVSHSKKELLKNNKRVKHEVKNSGQKKNEKLQFHHGKCISAHKDAVG